MSNTRRKRAVRRGGSRGGRGIQSVEIGARLLEVLSRVNEPVSLTRLGQEAGLPPSNAHRYLQSFIRTGFVRQDPVSGHYDLGHFALRIGLAAMARIEVLDLAARDLRALTSELHLTGLLCVWGELGATVVRWQRSSTPFVTSLGIGSVLPLLRSATGQVFLSWLPREVTAARLAAERRVAPGGTPRSENEIRELIRRTRERGFATVDGRVIPGLRAISCPVLDMQGEASAALTLLDTDPALGRRGHPATSVLLETCASLSRENGYGAPVPRARS